MKKSEVLAIIPAYNEEKNIQGVVAAIKYYVSDILVVNDGSSDNTAQLAAEVGAKVISHAANMGYGVAVQTGYKYAYNEGYEYVIQIDGDGQHDLKYIPLLLKDVMENRTDLSVGSRFLSPSGYKMTFLRKTGIKLFRRIISIIMKIEITDPTSGFQAFNRKVLELYKSDRFPWDYPDADVILALHYKGIRLKEIPVEMYYNEQGKSMHNGLHKAFYYAFKMSLSIFIVILTKKKFYK